MSRSQTKLRAVPTVAESAPDTSYEAEQRRHIMSRNWSAVHVEADRRSPFSSIMGKFR